MKNLVFGLSAAAATADELRRISHLPGFSFREFPGDVLDSPELRRELAASGGEIEIRDLAEPATLRRIVGEGNPQLEEEFERHFRRRLGCAVGLGIRRFSLDPDWETLSADHDYAKSAMRLFRILGSMLPMAMMRALRLRVRLPHGAVVPEAVRKLRRELGIPTFGILCELHPHEAGAFAAAERFLSLRGESDEWRIAFEPAAGNRLTAAPLRQLIARALPLAPEGVLRLTFAPEPATPDAALAAELRQLADELG